MFKPNLPDTKGGTIISPTKEYLRRFNACKQAFQDTIVLWDLLIEESRDLPTPVKGRLRKGWLRRETKLLCPICKSPKLKFWGISGKTGNRWKETNRNIYRRWECQDCDYKKAQRSNTTPYVIPHWEH